MRRLGRFLGRILIVLFLIIMAERLIAPRDGIDRDISFDTSGLPADLDVYLVDEEKAFSNIVPGTAKKIIWAGAVGQKTPLAIVYLHGYSATLEEIRPVPDRVAQELGANLFFTRLAGHGRGSAAMAEPAAGDWIEDTAEAIAIGRRLGNRVIVIGTSTGGTLSAIAATDPDLSKDLAGVVLIAPNFALRPMAAKILDMPFARWWGPLVAGQTRSFTPINAKHGQFWITSYPTISLFPLAALMREARGADYALANTPALVIYAEADQVIDPAAIAPVLAKWAGPVQIEKRVMGPGDDPFSHVIAGDILSPGQTDDTVALIVKWARGMALQ